MKIPQYFSHELPAVKRGSTGISPGVAAMPYEAAAQFGGAVADLGQKIFETEMKIQEGKKKFQNALDEAKALNEYEESLIDYMNDPEVIKDKLNYLPKMKYFASQKQGEILGKIKDQNLNKVLQIKLSDLNFKYYSKARGIDNKYWADTSLGKLYQELDRDQKLAANASTPEELAEIGDRGITLIDTAIKSGRLPPDDAAKLKISHADKIEAKVKENRLNMARAEIRISPDDAEDIIEKYDIPIDKIEPLIKLSTSLIEKREKGIEKGTKDFSGEMRADLTERMRKGEDVIDILYEYGPSNKKMLISNDFEGLITERDKLFGKVGEWKSDPNAEFEIEKNLYSSNPTITEKQIIAKTYEGVGGINKEKMSKYLENLRTWKKGQISEERTIINREYDEAKTHIATGLGISGMIAELYENIDPAQKKALHLAREELWRRSRGGGGKENPMDVAIEILPRYRRVLKDENLISIDNYQKLLMFPSPDSLKRAFKEKRITEGTFQTQQKIFFELSEKISMNGRIEEEEAAKPKQEKGKKGPYK